MVGTPKRQRNRRGEGAQLKDQLIEAAIGLLEKGDTDLTLRAIARELGIAAPSIYRHFADRDALVEAVVADCFEKLDGAIERALESDSEKGGPRAGAAPSRTARWRLQACAAAYVGFGLDHPGRYRILFDVRLPLPAGGRGDKSFARLADAVRACRAADRRGDTLARATNVWVALHGIVTLRTSRPHFDWPPVDSMIDAILEGQVYR